MAIGTPVAGTTVTGQLSTISPANLVVAQPSTTGAATTHILVARISLIAGTGTTACTTPAGWGILDTVVDGTIFLDRLYWRQWASSGSTTFVVSNAVADVGYVAQMVRIPGADTSSPLDTLGTQLSASGAGMTPSGITPSVPGCIVIARGSKVINWTSVATLSGGYSEIGEGKNTVGTPDHGSVWDYLVQTTATATGNPAFSITGDSSAMRIGRVLSIKPAATAVDLDRTASESIALSDAATKTSAFARSATESLSLSDVAAQSPLYARDAEDALALDDAASRAAQAFTRPVADAIALSDAAAVTAIQTTRYVSDGLTLSDAADADVGGALSRSTTETIALSDAATVSVALGRTASDELTLSDSASTGDDDDGEARSSALLSFYGR